MLELNDIARLRKQLGLTQPELAQLSGVSQSLIAKLEAGKIEPSYTKVKSIIDTLTGPDTTKVVDVDVDVLELVLVLVLTVFSN